MKRGPLPRLFRIPLIYFIFSVLWILFSDKLAFAASPDMTQAALFSTIKGLFFVVSSTLLIYLLLRAEETGKRRMLNEMVAVQRSFNLLFEDNPQPMFVYDDQSFNIVAVNLAACRIYGFSAVEFRKLKITDLFKKEDIPALLQIVAEHQAEIRQSGPWSHQIKDGKQIMVEIISHPLHSAGIKSTLVSVVDLTEHQKTLRELNAAMQQRDEFQSFGYTASHDLKSPIRAILGYSEILQKEYSRQLDDEGKRFIIEIHKAGENMNEMLDEMLILTGISRKPLQLEPLDMTEIFDELITSLRLQEPKRKVKVTIQPGMQALADKGGVKLITQNLVQNAWKFTKNTPRAHIQIGSLINDKGEQVFFVKDNGPGFDQHYAKQIFEPFKRAPLHSPIEGHGIGLSIVQRAVERHGGRVWVEAEPNKGANFYFTLSQKERS